MCCCWNCKIPVNLYVLIPFIIMGRSGHSIRIWWREIILYCPSYMCRMFLVRIDVYGSSFFLILRVVGCVGLEAMWNAAKRFFKCFFYCFDTKQTLSVFSSWIILYLQSRIPNLQHFFCMCAIILFKVSVLVSYVQSSFILSSLIKHNFFQFCSLFIYQFSFF